MELGKGFIAPILPPPDAVLERDPVTAALLNIRELLETLIAREVEPIRVEAPPIDLSSLTTALTAFGPPDAQAIGQAIAGAIQIPQPEPQDNRPLEALLAALEKLNFRMMGTGGGGSLSPDITDRPSRQLGIVSMSPDPTRADVSIFGSEVSEPLYDQISIDFATDVPASLVDTSGCANGGTATKAAGLAQMVLSSGTATNGVAQARSRSPLVYFPGHENRASETLNFSTPVAGATQMMWVTDLTRQNGFGFGYVGTVFTLLRRSAGTDYPVTAFDGTLPASLPKDYPWRIRYGLLGNADISLEYRANKRWNVLHTIDFPGADTQASIQKFTLYMLAEVVKTSGTTDVRMSTSSWAGQTVGDVLTTKHLRSAYTSTALGANANYTSAGEPCLGYSAISVTVKTDQTSASAGFLVEFSNDDFATVSDFYAYTYNAADVTKGAKTVVASPILGQSVRVNYTNGGTAQTTLNIQGLALRETPTLPTSALSSAADGTTPSVTVRFPLQSPIDNSWLLPTRSQPDSSNRVGQHVAIMKHDVATPILALTSWNTGQASIASTTTPVVVIPSPTSGRKTFMVKALSSNSKVVYVGPTAGVTAGNGWELAAGEGISVECDQTAGVYVIGSTATAQSLCWLEIE